MTSTTFYTQVYTVKLDQPLTVCIAFYGYVLILHKLNMFFKKPEIV